MKRFVLAMCVCMAVAMMVVPVQATELWDPHLRGVDEGGAAGALPPPGFYFVNDFYWINLKAFGPYWGAPTGHNNPAVKINVFVDAPILLWSTGCKFLGADYAVAIAQPFDFTNLRVQATAQPPGTFIGGVQWGTFNTIFVPAALSWKLCDWRIKAELQIAADDAMTSPGDVATLGGPYAASGNGYWSFTPLIGISYLHAGWNFSAEFLFSFNTENTVTHYQSGSQFAADYTVTYTCGKWTFGLGASQENGMENDSVFGITVPHSAVENYNMGPIIGYNFGPCSIQLIYNFPLYTNNEVGGEYAIVRLVAPLGNPFK